MRPNKKGKSVTEELQDNHLEYEQASDSGRWEDDTLSLLTPGFAPTIPLVCCTNKPGPGFVEPF